MIRTHFVAIPHVLILYGYVERWRSHSLSSKRSNLKAGRAGMKCYRMNVNRTD